MFGMVFLINFSFNINPYVAAPVLRLMLIPTVQVAFVV